MALMGQHQRGPGWGVLITAQLPPAVGFLHCDWLMKQRQWGLAAIPAGSSFALSDEALMVY